MKETISNLLGKDFISKNMKINIRYILDNYDEDQIENMLFYGMKIGEGYILLHYPNVGFRCVKDGGTEYLCNVIEKLLNKLKYNS